MQAGAGDGSGFTDAEYAQAGARLAPDAATVWAAADLLLKVKEPIASEYDHLRAGQTLFTYLHLAADRPLTEALVASGTTAVAYETIEDAEGRLPLLAPMSEIAGRLAAQAGAYFLQDPLGGRGLLIGGVPGVAAGARDRPRRRRRRHARGADRLRHGRRRHDPGPLAAAAARARRALRGPRARGHVVRARRSRRSSPRSDVVIGAVLVPGAAAPKLVTARACWPCCRRGAVLVDVAIDQGGCFETSHPTTHASPPSRSTASCTTASPTCPAPCPHVDARADQRDAALRAPRSPTWASTA